MAHEPIITGKGSFDERALMYIEKAEQIIQRIGWMVQPVATKPPYCYSIGLNRRELPEIMVVGFDFKVSRRLIDKAAELMNHGVVLTDWTMTREILVDQPVRFRELRHEEIARHCIMMPDLSGDHDYRMLQMFVQDERHLFPWNRECSSMFRQQCFMNMMYKTPPSS